MLKKTLLLATVAAVALSPAAYASEFKNLGKTPVTLVVKSKVKGAGKASVAKPVVKPGQSYVYKEARHALISVQGVKGEGARVRIANGATGKEVFGVQEGGKFLAQNSEATAALNTTKALKAKKATKVKKATGKKAKRRGKGRRI